MRTDLGNVSVSVPEDSRIGTRKRWWGGFRVGNGIIRGLRVGGRIVGGGELPGPVAGWGAHGLGGRKDGSVFHVV
jgi:hypothetical protein